MYGFGPNYLAAGFVPTPELEVVSWDGHPTIFPASPPFEREQEILAKKLYEKVYLKIRPRPERQECEDFLDYLVDEAMQLEEVYEAGDGLALYRASLMLLGTGRSCEWVTTEFRRLHRKFCQRRKLSALVRPGGRGRRSPLRIGVDGVWTAYVRIAYSVARQAAYNKTNSREVAGRILEKFRPNLGSSRKFSCHFKAIDSQLATPAEDVLPLLTVQHAAEITMCCCSWFAYIRLEEPWSLPHER